MNHNNSIFENSLSDDSEKVGFDTLYPALVEIFGIIAVGYISGRYVVRSYFLTNITTKLKIKFHLFLKNNYFLYL